MMWLRIILVLTALAAGTSPATAPSDQIRTWFSQLADNNPEAREQARINLMGIDRRELPALRQIIAETRPLRPSQAAVLHDIVTHAYLAGEVYDKLQHNGFLGIKLPPQNEPSEAIVVERVPGFVAFRMLRDGDVIVGIAEMPETNFSDKNQLMTVLRNIPAGTRVTLQIVRNGQAVGIPLRLDARPVVADIPPAMSQWETEREERAAQYWTTNFAPLLEDGGLTAAHP